MTSIPSFESATVTRLHAMHDQFSISRDGKLYQARRFLREDDAGRIYQTVYYLDSARCDPSAYTRFASDDPAMNAAAHAMLNRMVDEANDARTSARASGDARARAKPLTET